MGDTDIEFDTMQGDVSAMRYDNDMTQTELRNNEHDAFIYDI